MAALDVEWSPLSLLANLETLPTVNVPFVFQALLSISFGTASLVSKKLGLVPGATTVFLVSKTVGSVVLITL